jgi:hypothetical protein
MRIKDTFYFEKFPVDSLDYCTTDGRILRFDSQRGYKAEYVYELTRLPAETDDFPIDGIAMRIWLADSEGRVWSTVSNFTAEYLVDELGMCNFENVRDFYAFDKAPADIQKLFESELLLEGVYFTSDDRFYRSLRIGGEWVQAIFKYSGLTFDVALHHSPPSFPRLYARLRQGSGYDADQPLSEIRHTSELPALVFELSYATYEMLHAHSAIYLPRGSWAKSPLPLPIKFQLTEERGEPQVAVIVTSAVV